MVEHVSDTLSVKLSSSAKAFVVTFHLKRELQLELKAGSSDLQSFIVRFQKDDVKTKDSTRYVSPFLHFKKRKSSLVV